MKENLKPYVYMQWEHYPVYAGTWRCDRVLFVERSGELPALARLRTTGPEPKGNRVLRGREVSGGRPETG